jgi:hypothetical protein
VTRKENSLLPAICTNIYCNKAPGFEIYAMGRESATHTSEISQVRKPKSVGEMIAIESISELQMNSPIQDVFAYNPTSMFK